MKRKSLLTGLLLASAICPSVFSQPAVDLTQPTTSANLRPQVLGHGIGLFKVGNVLAEDDFQDLSNWVVQVQPRSGFEPPHVVAQDNTLDCLVPGRGCTAWFKEKLPPRVTITYDVLCPTHEPPIKGVRPTDINNFWMATDPLDAEQGLFDPARYTGAFGSYDKIHCYYASTGGRKNTTTRMRRYPREVGGEPTEHVALDNKDEKHGFLINPDQVMQVQLVAYDDVVQYIVDGKLVYQIGRGDQVQIETRNSSGDRVTERTNYHLERFPVYASGYFGFRMVGTHHVYSNFKVYQLEPADTPQRPVVRVDSLTALREVVAKSNQQIILDSGTYEVSDRNGFRFSGSNNDIDLTGCDIKIPIQTVSGRNLIRLTGDNITLRGGVFEDIYADGTTDVADFGAYNQKQKLGGMNEITVSGNDNRIVGIKMTIRGSFPYGYGNMFGIGEGSVLGLRKHCGIRITGDRAVIDSCEFKMQAFGHVIYVQGGDRTTVRNTMIEGTVRPSNDCYAETDEGDLAKRFNYQLQWPENVRGVPIPRDHMINCTEDGIRAYKGAGEMIVENCVVKKCRGGIKLYMAKSARVANCQVLDCVIQGYSLPSRGVISNSSGNAAYGPLLYVHFGKHSNQTIDLKVLPAPHAIGDHPLAAINGHGHSITFTQSGPPTSLELRPIIVGYPMRFDFLSVDYPEVPTDFKKHFAKYAPETYKASGNTIRNETAHPVVLGKLSQDNTVITNAQVRDLGTNSTEPIPSRSDR